MKLKKVLETVGLDAAQIYDVVPGALFTVNNRKLITMCAYCKKIKNEKARWQSIEAYFGEKNQSRFSHGMCPTCSLDAYKELNLIKNLSSQE